MFLNGVSYAIAGSGNFDSVNDTIIGLASGSAASITTNTPGTAVAAATFAPSYSVVVNADIKSSSTTPSTPSSVSTTSQSFQTVPEPASMMVFAAGLVGLAAAHDGHASASTLGIPQPGRMPGWSLITH